MPASSSLADLIVGSMITITYGTCCGVPVDAHAHVVAWLTRPAFQNAWGMPE